MKTVKIKDLTKIGATAYRVISYPFGNCPYYLISIADADVSKLNLSSDIVSDTATFFANYDLTSTTNTLMP